MEDTEVPASRSAKTGVIAPRGFSIDLEVGTNDHRIHKLPAVRGDTGQALCAAGQREVRNALARIDEFAEGLDLVER